MATIRHLDKSIDAIIELERRDAPATLSARVAELQQVCRDAAAIEKLSQTGAPNAGPGRNRLAPFCANGRSLFMENDSAD